MSFKISARVRQSSVTSNTLWANLNFFGLIICTMQIFCFWVHGGAPDLIYIQELPYMNTFCECILQKIGLKHAHFQYNSRKLVNVVKVRFTMMYSSTKLNNKKVITTACNFWRQIACSFQVYGPFHLTNIDVTSCFFRQIFRPFYEDKGQKIAIFNCEYLGDTCFSWAETS